MQAEGSPVKANPYLYVGVMQAGYAAQCAWIDTMRQPRRGSPRPERGSPRPERGSPCL